MADGAEQGGNFIEVRLDLAEKVPHGYGPALNEDGDRNVYPPTILDLVVADAAQQLIGVKERDLRKAIVKQVEGQVTSFVRSQMPAILKEALTGRLTIPATSEYGQDTVVPSLRDLIVKEAQQQLRKAGTDRYDRDKTLLQRLVAEDVKAALGGDLREEIEKARRVLREEIARRAQDLLGAAVEKDLESVSGEVKP